MGLYSRLTQKLSENDVVFTDTQCIQPKKDAQLNKVK